MSCVGVLQERLSSVMISFNVLMLPFRPCHLSEFSLAGSQYMILMNKILLYVDPIG